MIEVVVAAQQASSFSLFTNALADFEQVQVKMVTSAKKVLEIGAVGKVDVVVAGGELTDTDGLSLIKEVAARMPLVNTALVSTLSAEDFHEVTEGLGVFMQLPESPGAVEAEKMVKLLESISLLFTK